MEHSLAYTTRIKHSILPPHSLHLCALSLHTPNDFTHIQTFALDPSLIYPYTQKPLYFSLYPCLALSLCFLYLCLAFSMSVLFSLSLSYSLFFYLSLSLYSPIDFTPHTPYHLIFHSSIPTHTKAPTSLYFCLAISFSVSIFLSTLHLYRHPTPSISLCPMPLTINNVLYHETGWTHHDMEELHICVFPL